MRSPSRFLALPVWAFLALPLHATDVELVAGWEGYGGHGYAFVSPAVVAGSEGAWSAVIRGTAGYLYYTLPDPGGDTRVTSPGAALAVGPRLRLGRLTSTITVGYEVRDTKREPAQGAAETVREKGVTLQGDAFFQATPLSTFSLIASYGAANRYVWSRAGWKRQVTNRSFREPTALSLGLEVTGQGNGDLRAYSAGALFEVAFLPGHASLQLRGGFGTTDYAQGGSAANAYGGIGFYKRF